MTDRTPTPRRRTVFTNPTWEQVAASYLLVGGLWLLLFTASYPLVGAAIVTTIGLVAASARPAHRLVRCLRRCRTIHLDLGEFAQVRITRPGRSASCCEGPAG